MPRDEADALVAGRGAPGPGLRWHPEYPTTDTFVAIALLRLAHAADGWRSPQGRWWISQIVVRANGDDLVVGDIGFHAPPPAGAPAAVEIGYAVVPAWRGRGIATQACALMLEQAWSDGADVVRAEADSAASQAVLRKCGFRALGENWFEVSRP